MVNAYKYVKVSYLDCNCYRPTNDDYTRLVKETIHCLHEDCNSVDSEIFYKKKFNYTPCKEISSFVIFTKSTM